ncbi:extensin-like [Lathyrus oleraceus]|uniref:extensin-like n=1 Tax=Pisum sativum TaxID=3888 RepID=UPI0021D3D0DC|nr:extensin-like [Pisum sativum]
MEDVTVDTGRPLNARNLKSMGIIEQVRVKPTLDTSWETLKDQRKIPNGLYIFSKIDPPEVVAYYLQDLANQGVEISEFSVDWLPEHPPNFMKRMRDPSEKSKKAKKAKLGETFGSRPPVPLADSPKILNETTSPSSSSPSSPPYYILSSDNEPSDPQSPTPTQLQAHALASQQPSQTEPKPEVTSPPPKQQNPPPYDQPQTPPPAQPNPPPEQPIPSPSEPRPNP